MENQFGAKVFEGAESIYLGIDIDKVTGDREAFACIKLGPCNYEGRIRDMSILPDRRGGGGIFNFGRTVRNKI